MSNAKYAVEQTDMTDQYAELRAALNAGPTPGPWTGHRMGIEKDRIGEYVQASVNVSPGDDFFFICAKRPDGSDADLCLTGNGPTSAINTQYIIASNPEVIRALLAERDALAKDADVLARAAEWLSCNDRGLSSIAIFGHMIGSKSSGDYPWDPSDLGRCLRLLEFVPEWKSRIGEMAKYGPAWAALASKWEELASLMAEEVGIDWSKGRIASRTYAAMKSVLDAAMAGGEG